MSKKKRRGAFDVSPNVWNRKPDWLEKFCQRLKNQSADFSETPGLLRVSGAHPDFELVEPGEPAPLYELRFEDGKLDEPVAVKI